MARGQSKAKKEKSEKRLKAHHEQLAANEKEQERSVWDQERSAEVETWWGQKQDVLEGIRGKELEKERAAEARARREKDWETKAALKRKYRHTNAHRNLAVEPMKSCVQDVRSDGQVSSESPAHFHLARWGRCKTSRKK